MVSYKLTYFDGRGAGEVSRQILAYAGQQFEDKRVSQEQWPALKDSKFSELFCKQLTNVNVTSKTNVVIELLPFE